MRKIMLALTLVAAAAIPTTPATAATSFQTTASDQAWNPPTAQHSRGDRYRDRHWDRDDRRYHRERRLSRNDRIWRGRDGRYHCRRSDGTTGLIVGAALGGILGNQLDGGRDRTLGTILGIAGGGLIGREIDRGNVRCR